MLPLIVFAGRPRAAGGSKREVCCGEGAARLSRVRKGKETLVSKVTNANRESRCHESRITSYKSRLLIDSAND
jgi:hypothetical protein